MARRAWVAWSSRKSQVAQWVSRHEREQRSYRRLAQEAGVPLPSLYAWVKRLREERATSAGGGAHSRFVELAPALECAATDASGVELVLGGARRIRVAVGFDAATLERLLVALGA